jgi:hypothetical protein
MKTAHVLLATLTNVLVFIALVAVSLLGTFGLQNLVLAIALGLTIWAFVYRRDEVRWGLLVYDLIGVGLLVLYLTGYEMR